ncbi:hypothetical protein OSJ77_08230 [Phyllobacterium sp. 0TCS1.6C]|nr:hypothetical protein [Phyllobacterium sp. 0TCS1.6C]
MTIGERFRLGKRVSYFIFFALRNVFAALQHIAAGRVNISQPASTTLIDT